MLNIFLRVHTHTHTHIVHETHCGMRLLVIVVKLSNRINTAENEYFATKITKYHFKNEDIILNCRINEIRQQKKQQSLWHEQIYLFEVHTHDQALVERIWKKKKNERIF